MTLNLRRILQRTLSATSPLVLLVLPSAVKAAPPPGYSWTQVWEDEFNGSSVDTSRWRIADKNRDSPNTTRYTPDNVSVSYGTLTLKVRNDENYCARSTCTNWSGGMLESYDGQSNDEQKYRLFKFGYYEARIRYHLYGCGLWANFWMYARPKGPEEFDLEIMSCTGAAGTTSRANQIRPAYHYSGGTSSCMGDRSL
jgi:beta-glucanase (GH16 family)